MLEKCTSTPKCQETITENNTNISGMSPLFQNTTSKFLEKYFEDENLQNVFNSCETGLIEQSQSPCVDEPIYTELKNVFKIDKECENSSFSGNEPTFSENRTRDDFMKMCKPCKLIVNKENMSPNSERYTYDSKNLFETKFEKKSEEFDSSRTGVGTDDSMKDPDYVVGSEESTDRSGTTLTSKQ